MEQGKWKVHHVAGPQGRARGYTPDLKFSSNHSKRKTYLFCNWLCVCEINQALWSLLEPGLASTSFSGSAYREEMVWCALMSYMYQNLLPMGSHISPVGLTQSTFQVSWWRTPCGSSSPSEVAAEAMLAQQLAADFIQVRIRGEWTEYTFPQAAFWELWFPSMVLDKSWWQWAWMAL